ncbi:prolipoprotein diacylglyceryl transferase [Cryobacterium sp. 1639]|uniref:prolipoprotein diacylglyceryl transferase n=1 Tax=Cryobacterium inferilacus TaxID=2866629 RepID=UPI001C732B64|nr:prolipoprotein diacylglyceryl transferase [Cryobacterium sp. 1639]MBX0301888.1 prolipoprotein diacylglyceryl transferase [Cryobacterium sp. 1639]
MNVPLSIPSPDISSFQLGPFQIHFYALFILSGIAAAVILTSRRLTARGGAPDTVLDIALWAVPFGIIGGRFYHVITHPTDYFFPGADLWKTFYVWEGGLAIFGAILFGSLGAYIACRRAGVRFLSFADALAPGMLLAQAFGRLGNYFNQELFGTPTTLPWGLQIDPTQPAFPTGLPEGTLFHPLFLYEIVWNLLGVMIILLVERRFNLRWGKALGLYLIIYGMGRTWFESFRLDPTEFELGGFKINMLIATLVAVAGMVLFIVQSRRHPELETDPTRSAKQGGGELPSTAVAVPASSDAPAPHPQKDS